MPKGVYVRTIPVSEETRNKLRIIMLNNKYGSFVRTEEHRSNPKVKANCSKIGKMNATPFRNRFWLHIVLPKDTDNECWEWNGSTSNGRPYYNFGDSKDSVYREIYRQFVGQIEEENVIHHKCFNMGCCNPNHLEQMSNFEHRILHIQIGHQ